MVVTVRQFEISSRVLSPVVRVCLSSVWLKNAMWKCVQRRANAGLASTEAHGAGAGLEIYNIYSAIDGIFMIFFQIGKTYERADTRNLLWVISKSYF